MGRRPGGRHRQVGVAVIAAGAALMALAVYGLAGTGDVRHQVVAACLTLPGGLLALLAGSELVSRARTPSRSLRLVVDRP